MLDIENLLIKKSIITTKEPNQVDNPDGEYEWVGVMPSSKSKESDK